MSSPPRSALVQAKALALILGLALTAETVAAQEARQSLPAPASREDMKGFQCPTGAKDSGFSSGKLERWCEILRDGRPVYHGPLWRWYENGQMEGKEYYLNGNAEGEWPSWYENGSRSSLGSWRAGSKIGLWRYWDQSGHIT